MFSSRSFMVSALMVKSSIYFELIWGYGVGWMVLGMWLSSFSNRVLKSLSFPCCIFVGRTVSCHKLVDHVCVS